MNYYINKNIFNTPRIFPKQGRRVYHRYDANENSVGLPSDFVEMVKKVVRLNQEWIPTYESGATLYIRPLLIGTSAQVGVHPSDEYLFMIFVTPVGPYFKGGVKPIKVKISDFDRAAPRGTGNIKAGLNYAMSLHAIVTAHEEGFDENMYLDPKTRTYVEETGGANFIFITRDGGDRRS